MNKFLLISLVVLQITFATCQEAEETPLSDADSSGADSPGYSSSYSRSYRTYSTGYQQPAQRSYSYSYSSKPQYRYQYSRSYGYQQPSYQQQQVYPTAAYQQQNAYQQSAYQQQQQQTSGNWVQESQANPSPAAPTIEATFHTGPISYGSVGNEAPGVQQINENENTGFNTGYTRPAYTANYYYNRPAYQPATYGASWQYNQNNQNAWNSQPQQSWSQSWNNNNQWNQQTGNQAWANNWEQQQQPQVAWNAQQTPAVVEEEPVVTKGLPSWRRSYTPLPGQSGCFNRCRPSCGAQTGVGYGCKPSCRSACNIRPSCGAKPPMFAGNTMVCGRNNWSGANWSGANWGGAPVQPYNQWNNNNNNNQFYQPATANLAQEQPQADQEAEAEEE